MFLKYLFHFKLIFVVTMNPNAETISYLSSAIDYVQDFNEVSLEVLMPLINYEDWETNMALCEDIFKVSIVFIWFIIFISY